MSAQEAHRVADGPINGTGWYILDNPPPELLAPGGVVLLHDATLRPHARAGRAAASAWELLRRYRPNTTPPARSEQLSGQHG
jgi:hypothetical protein